MINKAKLTRLLRDASDLEEGYMEFLTGYIEKYFDWTGYDPEKVKTVRKLLEKLRTESERHKRVLEDILEWVSGRKENEF